MNAQLPVKIENIDLYKDILPEGFIQEIKERHELLQNSKKEISKSIRDIRKNFDSMAQSMDGLGEAFGKNSGVFARLEGSYQNNSSNLGNLANSANDISSALRNQADTIKKNIQSSDQ